MSDREEAKEVAELRARAEALGYLVVQPFGKVTYHGEGADEEFELVPTSRQRVYEDAIAGLKAKLGQRR